MFGKRDLAATCAFVLVIAGQSGVPWLSANSVALAAGKNAADESANQFESVDGGIRALLKEYYPKAKITQKGSTFRFEYKLRPYTDPSSGRQVIGPDLQGILGEMEMKPGQYSGLDRLPAVFPQTLYTILVLAPYSQQQNAHLFCRLHYPPDAAPEFLKEFKHLITEFEHSASPVPSKPSSNRKSTTFSQARVSEKDTTLNTTAASSDGLGKTAVHSLVDQSRSTSSDVGLDQSKSASASQSPASTAASSASQSPASLASAAPVSQADGAPKQAPDRSESAKPTPSASANQAQGRKLYMWKATRGKDTVYLLGTIHGAKFDFYPLPVEMDQAFERSRHLVLEVVIDRVDVEKLKPAVEAISYYKPPDKLSLHLSEETKRVMEEYLRWSGESWALYEKYRPWLVVEMLAGSRRWRGESFKGSLGIDRYLLSRARNLGKAVSELETAEFQSTLFKNLSDKVQDKLLQVTIKHLKDMDEETKAVVKAWKNGDVDMLESYSRDAKKDPDLAPYDKVLLDDRNIGMAAKLEQLLKTKPGPHFVAVGAAHMVGETGLPNLLKKQGFSVEQITAKPAGTEPSAEKLVKRRFPREGFSIWLPGQPKRSASLIQSIDTVSFEFNEIPDGIYYIQCITIPVDESKLSIPGPLLLDKLVAECTRKYNVIGRKTISIEGNPGREADYVPKTPRDIPAGLGKEDIGARLRAVLVGRKVFMLLAVGKKPWLKCSHVNQFMDSLELAK